MVAPERGTSIGRFIVLRALGVGGMGIVMSAYDPDLARNVAVKLLRGDVWRGARAAEGHASLVREAQAMGRLNHPNVVAVHEVGQWQDGSYVVMEQVNGGTLRGWLAEQPRRWREILDMLIVAGAGLAAAHRAGVVHRDFKPDNVLVGNDGRPRVSDFGLAGASVIERGTQDYMAPEQRAGVCADAFADQYAFCVTAWEGLHGARPPRDRVRPPASKLPAWLDRALARGLADEPGDRWPSMDALLAELLRRRRGSRLAIAAVAVAAASVAAFLLGAARSAPPTCDGASARLVGVWDPPRQAAVHAAFAATQLAYADAAWRGASAQLDDYTRAWTAMHTEACRATHVDGRQSAALLDLRMACLERRRSAVGALTQLWATGVTAETLQAAVAAPRGLPVVDECADARALTQRTPLPSDPITRLEVVVTRARIDAATALRLAGRPEARLAATAARAQADATGWSQVRAEAALAEGQALSDLELASAVQVLIEAARLGGEARDDRLAAEAQIDLVHHLSEAARDPAAALLAADLAEGVLLRAGDDPRLRVQLLRFRGTALLGQNRTRDAAAMFTAARDRAAAALGARDWETMTNVAELARVAEAEGDYAEARRLGDEVVAAAIERFGPDHPRVASLLNNLAIAVDEGGDHEAAIGYHRRALVIKDKVLGPDSASTATTLNNLGILEIMFGHLDDGQARLERALGIRERLLGPDHPFVANTLDNLAVAHRMRGHNAEALALLDRALAIGTRTYGSNHASVAPTLVKIGTTWSASGDEVRAGDYYRRALAIRRIARGPNHPSTLNASNLVAGALVARGRCEEARPLLAPSVAILEPATGRPTGNLAAALALVAECDLARGQLPRAAEQAERALAIREAAHSAAAEIGGVRWLLGRARWAQGQRDAAITAVRQAVRELGGDATVSRQLAAARAWLAARER